MSPLSIVGITLLTTVLADVSHVLQGQAHPPVADPQEINNAAFTTKNAKDFWWMQDDSPLKASYDFFKKCAATGKCATGKHELKFSSSSSGTSTGPIDLNKNVFLNGNFAAAGGSASFSESLSGGSEGGASDGPKSFHSGAKIDLSTNPFLQGGFAHAGQGVAGALCAGSDKICVPKQDCVNGVVSTNGLTKSIINKCAEHEVCCQLPSGKSSLAEHVNQLVFAPGKSKFTGKDGLTPEQVQIIHSSQEGIRPQFNFIGESDGSSTIKPVRDITAAASDSVFSSTPDYSNVQFGNDARFSNLEGLDYLPPHPSSTTTPRPTPPPPSCAPGQFLNNFGRCEPIKEPCPAGTRPTPSGGCEKLKIECPSGQKPGPYGGCVTIQTPPPIIYTTTKPPPPACPPGQKPGAYGGCVPVSTPAPPTTPLTQKCGFGQRPTPFGGCENIPTSTPPTITTGKPYCPSGQRVGLNGQCISVVVCGAGQRQTPFGGCEDIVTRPPTQCPFGQKPGSYGTCIPVSPTTTEKPYCPSGQREGPNGQCIKVVTCGPGQKETPFGGCEDIVTRPPITPSTQCPFGQKPGPYGGCVPVTPPTPPTTTVKPYCPSGQREGPNGQCIKVVTCGLGQRETPFGGCEDIVTRPPVTPSTQCPFGQKPGPYGGCVPVSPPTPPTTTVKPYCPSGQREGPNGQCIKVLTCGPGQKETPFGGCEDIVTRPPVTPSTQCPFGQKPGPYGGCVPVSPPTPSTTTVKPYCPSGQREGPNGQCIKVVICGPGQKETPFGGCEDIVTRPPVTPSTQCPFGQKPGPYGGCVPVSPPTPPTITVKPYCPSGQREGPNGQCIPVVVCRPGQKQTLFGSCEDITTRPPPPTQCPFGQKPGPYGSCVPTRPYCPSGQREGPNGQCIPVTPKCGFGQRPTSFGGCEDITSTTLPPVSTKKPYCPSGQREGPNGECLPVIICGAGQRPTPVGGCEDIVTRPPTTTPSTRPSTVRCGPGQTLGSYGQCISISTPSPPTPTPGIYCNAGERVGPNGKCIKIPSCPPGHTIGPFGQCITSSTPPTPPSEPACPPGQKPSPFGGCVTIRTPAPPTTSPPIVTCQPGYTLGPYGKCIPPQTPYCLSGQRIGPNGECIDVVTPRPQPTCGPGQKPGPYGDCVDIEHPTTPSRPICPSGSFPTASGGCQRPTPPPTLYCPPGTVKTPSGRCETPTPPPGQTCPPGSYLGPSGNCVSTPTTSRNYLPPKNSTTRPPGYDYTPTTPYIPDRTGQPGNNIPTYLRPTTSPPTDGSSINSDLIPVGCAAALKCVQEIYCTADGFVSPVPVVLTKEQELLRAPTTVCRDIGSGTLGKCCRDRDYQDPWPSANLVNGVDDGRYAEDDSLGQYKAENNRISRSSSSRKSRSKRAAEGCGVRNLNSSPPGQGPIDADFAEISWQAMILRDSNRSLLCGGAIIRKNAVLTAAHCVEGLETSDILIKGGEWKLGIDEEPLPFQIVRVAAILRHPDFRAGSLQNDLAVLVLEENLRFTKNIGQICLPEPNLIPTQNCIATGWGKRILQLHAKNALMHKIDVNIMEVQQCQQVMGEHFQNALPNYNTNTLCGFSNIDQCKVDYGSALACADDSGRYTLGGVYAWDTGCKLQGQIGGYVAPDVDWIENVLDTPLKQLKRIDRAYNTARLQQVA